MHRAKRVTIKKTSIKADFFFWCSYTVFTWCDCKASSSLGVCYCSLNINRFQHTPERTPSVYSPLRLYCCSSSPCRTKSLKLQYQGTLCSRCGLTKPNGQWMHRESSLHFMLKIQPSGSMDSQVKANKLSSLYGWRSSAIVRYQKNILTWHWKVKKKKSISS